MTGVRGNDGSGGFGTEAMATEHVKQTRACRRRRSSETRQTKLSGPPESARRPSIRQPWAGTILEPSTTQSYHADHKISNISELRVDYVVLSGDGGTVKDLARRNCGYVVDEQVRYLGWQAGRVELLGELRDGTGFVAGTVLQALLRS